MWKEEKWFRESLASTGSRRELWYLSCTPETVLQGQGLGTYTPHQSVTGLGSLLQNLAIDIRHF